ncbi:MAG: hypothetical protein LBH46_03575, partial [Rickettsiales bacterium]|nr:hypothetical protein [Rickettsiales bacterium]
ATIQNAVKATNQARTMQHSFYEMEGRMAGDLNGDGYIDTGDASSNKDYEIANRTLLLSQQQSSISSGVGVGEGAGEGEGQSPSDVGGDLPSSLLGGEGQSPSSGGNGGEVGEGDQSQSSLHPTQTAIMELFLKGYSKFKPEMFDYTNISGANPDLSELREFYDKGYPKLSKNMYYYYTGDAEIQFGAIENNRIKCGFIERFFNKIGYSITDPINKKEAIVEGCTTSSNGEVLEDSPWLCENTNIPSYASGRVKITDISSNRYIDINGAGCQIPECDNKDTQTYNGIVGKCVCNNEDETIVNGVCYKRCSKLDNEKYNTLNLGYIYTEITSNSILTPDHGTLIANHGTEIDLRCIEHARLTIEYGHPTLLCEDGNWKWKSDDTNNSARCDLSGSKTFTFTGEPQPFSLNGFPTGSKLKFAVWGAEGGSFPGNSSYTISKGGKGGYTRATYKVGDSSLSLLYVYVGEGGSLDGVESFNGGGGVKGINTAGNEASGGGASDIRTVGGDWSGSEGLGSRLIVAGGGGGASSGTSEEGGAGAGGDNNGGSSGGGGWGPGAGGGASLTRKGGATVDDYYCKTYGKGECHGGGGWYGGCAVRGSANEAPPNSCYAGGGGGGSGYCKEQNGISGCGGESGVNGGGYKLEHEILTGKGKNGCVKICWGSDNSCDSGCESD